jgi:hypothetical protein
MRAVSGRSFKLNRSVSVRSLYRSIILSGTLVYSEVNLTVHVRQVAGNKALAAHDAAQQALHAKGMTNEQLAHELLLDRNFRLSEKAGISADKLVHTQLRETFKKDFWDSVAVDLATTPPSFVRILSVLTEIKQSIEELTAGQ